MQEKLEKNHLLLNFRTFYCPQVFQNGSDGFSVEKEWRIGKGRGRESLDEILESMLRTFPPINPSIYVEKI